MTTRFAATASCLAALAPLAGACSSVMPGQDAGGGLFASPKATAAVIIAVNRAPKQCPKPAFTIGREAGGHYEAVVSSEIGKTVFGYAHYKVLRLATGTYHIVAASCRDGRSLSSIGSGKADDILGMGKIKYRKSLASFRVEQPGEVVNAGSFLMIMKDGFGTIRIGDLPPAALQQLRKTRPELAARMTSRIMQRRTPNASDANGKPESGRSGS